MNETLYCTCCERKLDPAKTVWLELDQRIGEYHDEGVPEDSSQGAFPFGPSCARKAKATARLAMHEYEQA